MMNRYQWRTEEFLRGRRHTTAIKYVCLMKKYFQVVAKEKKSLYFKSVSYFWYLGSLRGAMAQCFPKYATDCHQFATLYIQDELLIHSFSKKLL